MAKEFKWQLINPAKGTGPLMFLILAAVLGVIQVLFGVLIDGIWKLKQKKYLDAVLDSFLWLYFLGVMLLFGLSKGGIFLAEQADIITILVWVGVGLLVLTQGRKQKNIFVELVPPRRSLRYSKLHFERRPNRRHRFLF